jgi:hypothetical protein
MTIEDKDTISENGQSHIKKTSRRKRVFFIYGALSLWVVAFIKITIDSFAG